MLQRRVRDRQQHEFRCRQCRLQQDVAAVVRIAYPAAALAEVREHLSGLHVEPLGAHQRGGEGSSEVRVLIAEKEIDANSDVMQIQVGDIVSTGVPCSELAKIEIGGHIRYLGRLGQHEGRKAILIVREADGQEARVVND